MEFLDSASSPVSLVWYPGIFIIFSEPLHDYMTLWGKKKTASEQISQLFLNPVYGFVSVIPMSPELSVEFPITQNRSKSLSRPSDAAEHN